MLATISSYTGTGTIFRGTISPPILMKYYIEVTYLRSIYPIVPKYLASESEACWISGKFKSLT